MKSKITSTFLFLFLLSLTQNANAQCMAAAYEYLDGNKVNAAMSNGADHFWDFVGASRYEVPKGSGKHSLFAGSIWIGGMDTSNTLYVAANTYRQQGTDFYAGPYRSSGNYVCGRGFESPSNLFTNGLLTLASGKVVALYSNGFTVYDPASNTSLSRVLPVIKNEFQAVELPDGRLMLFGDDVYPVKSDVLIVDTVNFNFQQIGQINFFHKRSSATRLGNGQILLAGIAGCEVFDPATTSSAPVAAMNSPRLQHAAALLPNGKVLIAGGSTNLSGTGFMPGTEIYDPGSSIWATGPTMSVGRNRPRATRLASGEVLLTGGASSQADFNLYNATTNTMSAQPGLPAAINENNVAQLANGDLLIAGNNPVLNSAHLHRYNPSSQSTQEVRLIGVGAQVTGIAGGLVMIERSQNKFAQFDPDTQQLIDQPWQNTWKLSRSQINQFITDHANNSVNFANYPDIETWPAHGDVAAGEDLHLAPFVDVNNDGLYSPLLHGDYPCIEGDQALWWVYNDDGIHTETTGNAMEIQVEQMSYAYDCGSTPCTPDSFLDYTTFHHLEITNKSDRDYVDVYVGLWLDVDLGNWSDDYVGSDSSLGLGFAYNGDPNDETASGYGQNPPALGTMFLENGDIGKATNFIYYENDFSIHGNPEMPAHFYNYMRSVWKDGSPVTVGGNGQSGSGPVTNFMYSGDAGFCGGGGSGWSEVSANNAPFDRRYLHSYGPIDLAAGQKLEMDYVVLWARGYYNDNLGSVCELKKAAVVVDSFWQAQSHGCFDIVLGKPEPKPEQAGFALYPNPNQGNFSLEFEEAIPEAATLTIYDLAGHALHSEGLRPMQRRCQISSGNLAEGVYLVRVTNAEMALTRKMVVTR